MPIVRQQFKVLKIDLTSPTIKEIKKLNKSLVEVASSMLGAEDGRRLERDIRRAVARYNESQKG